MSTPYEAGTGRAGVVDLGELIDRTPITSFQVLVITCCAAVAFFDGLDTQSIGVAAPLISQAFRLPPGSLGPVFSAGLVGALVGAVCAGSLGDRFGRRPSLIGAVLLMAAGTFATASSRGVPGFLVTRFVAGLGLGAAVPCAIALTAEYAPSRLRGRAISVMWAAFPLGGFLGGIINPPLGESFGWSGIFYFGGLVPVLLALACLFMPESLRYLIAARSVDRPRIQSIVRRLSASAARAEQFVAAEASDTRGSLRALVREGRARPTIVLWVLSIITFSGLVFQPLWAPSILVHPGVLTFGQAGFVVAMANLGSVLGTGGFGRLFDRFGLVPVMASGYALAALALGFVAWPGGGFYGAATAAFISCLCLGGTSGGLFNLAASSYPTLLRSTGIGAVVSLGRVGQITETLQLGVLLEAGWKAPALYLSVAAAALAAAVLVLLQPNRSEALAARNSQSAVV